MRVLFTGGSSFSGFWFIQELANRGHQLVVPLRKALSAYEGVRRKRVDKLLQIADVRFEVPYGSSAFLDLLNINAFDLFCHHAADVTNYKSPDFDVLAAVNNNVGPLSELLRVLKNRNCLKIALTGTVFEPGEGHGSDGLRAVSPYGLSKGLTASLFKYYCASDFHLGKFVIPNPFGPYEEQRFTAFLIQNWLARKVAPVTLPAYVRDNIHISLLAKAYGHFIEKLPSTVGYSQLNPSGYCGSQGAFTERVANEMRPRLKLPCEYILHAQTTFSEPKERINFDALTHIAWNENEAWDQLAEYYS